MPEIVHEVLFDRRDLPKRGEFCNQRGEEREVSLPVDNRLARKAVCEGGREDFLPKRELLVVIATISPKKSMTRENCGGGMILKGGSAISEKGRTFTLLVVI